MPKIPFDDDGRYEIEEPPELSEAAKQALARQRKLDDGNFITERTLAFQRDMAAEFARAQAAGDTGDPMFVKDLMKLAPEMRTEHLSDIPRGPGGKAGQPRRHRGRQGQHGRVHGAVPDRSTPPLEPRAS